MKYRLATEHDRANVLQIISLLNIEKPQQIEIKAETRTLEQNARMWAMLTDVSKQVKWAGEYLTPVDWKTLITAAIKKQRIVPGLEGGLVALGESTSKMTIAAMTEVIEYLFYFGAENNVVWNDPRYKTYQEWAENG